jgi:flagellar hook-associated protein FlgK
MKKWLQRVLGIQALQEEAATLRRALTAIDGYHDQQHSTAFRYISQSIDQINDLRKDFTALSDANRQLTQVIMEMHNNDFK